MPWHRNKHLRRKVVTDEIGSLGSSNPSFLYPPLPKGEASFRLFTLTKFEAKSGTFHGRLDPFLLHECPTFRALSYTWRSPFYHDHEKQAESGSEASRSSRLFSALRPSPQSPQPETDDWESPTQVIMCNDQPFGVRQNLFDALHQLCKPRYQGYLWIDAICINQNNPEEKNTQVPLMGKIYSSATQVLAWLGRGDEDLERFQLVQDTLWPVIEKLQEEQGKKEATEYSLADDAVLRTLGVPTHLRAKLAITSQSDINSPAYVHWKSFGDFYRRRWFTRAWVVQEVSLATRVLVLCGSGELNWDDMVRLVFFLGRCDWCEGVVYRAKVQAFDTFSSPTRTRFYATAEDPKLKFREMEPVYHKFDETDSEIAHSFLLYAVITHSQRQAANPRDKLYAFIGLTEKYGVPGAEITKVDYSVPVSQLYTEIASKFLKTIPLLHILSLGGAGPHRTSGLPSWVPDFSSEKRSTLLATNYYADDFRAGLSGRPLPMTRTITGNRLSLEGYHIDTVADCIFTEDSASLSDETFVSWFRILQHIPSIYRNGQSCIEVFWRTLTVDQDYMTRSLDTRRQALEGFLCWRLRTFARIHYHSWLDDADSKEWEDLLRVKSPYRELLEELGSEARIPSLNEVAWWCATSQNGTLSRPGDRRVEILKASKFGRVVQIGNRQLFRTKDDLLGFGPHPALGRTEVGDQVWIIKDARVPFILRPVPGSDDFELVGESYVHGVMRGEAVEGRQEEDFQTIGLI